MDKNSKLLLSAAIVQTRAVAPGKIGVEDLALAVIESLATKNPDRWAIMRAEMAIEAVSEAIRVEIRHELAADTRQAWLPLPEFQHIRQFAELGGARVDLRELTLEQYRECESALEAKIKAYAYPRRTGEKAKADQRELREMKRLERKVAPYFAGNPAMTMGLALEMYQASLETPAKKQRRKASVGAHKARWGFTGNQ